MTHAVRFDFDPTHGARSAVLKVRVGNPDFPGRFGPAKVRLLVWAAGAAFLVGAAFGLPLEIGAQAQGESPHAENRQEEMQDAVVAPVELVLDFGTRDIHVIRLEIADDARRKGEFDALLEKQGLSFFPPNANPNQGAALQAAQAPLREIDMIYLAGVPTQIERVLDAVKRRRHSFQPQAVYTTPKERINDWIAAIVETLPEAPNAGRQARLPVPPAPPIPPAPPNAFAWRMPPDRDLIERYFPVPQAPAPNQMRLGPAQVPPDKWVQVIFILIRRS